MIADLQAQASIPPPRKPDWLKVRLRSGPNYAELKQTMRGLDLHTVCEEARCPNIWECWENRTATFMILGEICTRNCGFCAVTSGRPTFFDWHEPVRVAEAVERLGLKHVVVTSVDRDDLPDGGARIFAETIRRIRERVPGCGVEVLTPDFQGDFEALATVMAAQPDIFNHNLETVPRLYRRVRPKAKYAQSLGLLRRAKALDPGALTKTGIMVGIGEEWDEIEPVLRDIRAHDVDIVTIGQYLRPTSRHLPVSRYYTPAEFETLRAMGEALGFQHVESGPLVRSSYHAHNQVEQARTAPAAPARGVPVEFIK
jgi:lipoic acid synthetase